MFDDTEVMEQRLYMKAIKLDKKLQDLNRTHGTTIRIPVIDVALGRPTAPGAYQHAEEIQEQIDRIRRGTEDLAFFTQAVLLIWHRKPRIIPALQRMSEYLPRHLAFEM